MKEGTGTVLEAAADALDQSIARGDADPETLMKQMTSTKKMQTR